MYSSIRQYLEKLGIKNPKELNDLEKEFVKQWEKELSSKPVLMADVLKFIKSQREIVGREFEDFTNSKDKDMFLRITSRLYTQLITLIEMPDKIKEAREQDLKAKTEAEANKGK